MKQKLITFSHFLRITVTICALILAFPLLAQNSWSVGDRIFGQAGDGNWYSGYITQIHSKGYKVKYDVNGKTIVNAKKIAPYTWKVGSSIRCKIQGGGNDYYRGKLISANQYNQFDVHFDRGNIEPTWSSSCIYDGTPFIPAPKTNRVDQYSPPPPGSSSRKFGPGEAVLAYHTGYWYPAKIMAVQIQDYAIKFSGGLEMNYVESHLSPVVWRQGSPVECTGKGKSAKSQYYKATVEAINNSEIWVIFSNNVRQTLIHGKCRSK
ncbi:hypothetical protein GARC_1283 [Paraglaciecola arctica BSs20135]|uniref:Agenet-like domain-containing protein n=1 Tax=Paraglaciecola arctica BSs20135 TaxID=493475 RepID=K6YNP1_9ALTE|nr:hypothetical protein GARC_1283 [Paraglaciecola arctica BSs20135]